MKKISNKNIYVKNPETGEYESIVGFQGESAYDAAVRLGKTNLSEEKWIAEYVEKRNEAIEAIDNEGNAVLQSLPDDYVKMSSDVRQKATAISNKQSGQLIHIPNGSPQQVLSLITHIEPVQFGSGDPSPNNIRPISGWDSVSATRTGRNLLYHDAEKVVNMTLINSSGEDVSRKGYLVELPAGAYVIKGEYKPDYTAGVFITGLIVGTDLHHTGKTALSPVNGTTVNTTKFTLADGEKLALYDGSTGHTVSQTKTAFDKVNLYIFTDDGNTKNEEYNGETLTANLPETVCGGTLNWTTGKLYKAYHKIIFDGVTVGKRLDGTDSTSTAYTYAYMSQYNMPAPLKNKGKKYGNMTTGIGMTTVLSLSLPLELTGVTPTDDRATIVSKNNALLKQWYDAGTPLEVVYEIDTPIEYQLTPQQLETLKGVNNIWSDAGETEVVYALDTKEYVDAIDVLKAPAIIENVSGGLVTINDQAECIPIKSLITTIAPKQEGSGDPSPVNTRPISGWNSVRVNGTGKNLVIFPYYDVSKTVNGITFTVNNDGTVTAQGTAAANAVFNLCYTRLNTGSYFLSGGKSNGMRVVANKQKNGVDITGVFDSGNGTTLVLDAQTVVHLYIVIIAGTTVNDTFAAQLESGSTATAYELYQGQTLTADLPETVYGGTLDWTTGVLTVDEAIVAFTGTETWRAHNTIDTTVYMTTPSGMASALVCSHYKVAAVSSNDLSVNIGIQLNFRDSVNAVDVDTWKAYLAAQVAAGTPVTLVCKIKNPYTIQLEPQQLEMLKGTNNIWSDAGQTEVTYAADTKMYADGKDTTSMIGKAEPGMIATKNYTSGSFIVVGKNLYKATAAIATGETIAPGTNCTATTVVEQLEAIYNLLNT